MMGENMKEKGQITMGKGGNKTGREVSTLVSV